VLWQKLTTAYSVHDLDMILVSEALLCMLAARHDALIQLDGYLGV